MHGGSQKAHTCLTDFLCPRHYAQLERDFSAPNRARWRTPPFPDNSFAQESSRRTYVYFSTKVVGWDGFGDFIGDGSAIARGRRYEQKSWSEFFSGCQDRNPCQPGAGLTDRERMLLDRVEQLEKRVAELEAKGPKTESAATSPAAPAGQPLAEAASAPSIGLGAPSLAGVSTSTATNSSPASAAGIGPKQDQAVTHVGANAKPQKAEPFAFADWTWLNGNSRTKDSPLDTKYFTGEFRADTSYIYDFAHPQDHTLVGSSESGRTDEFQVQQLGIGGDFHVGNVRGRLMTQFGMYSTMPRAMTRPPARSMESG